jgi:drug/metabolite transporter (DMT)-like permease
MEEYRIFSTKEYTEESNCMKKSAIMKRFLFVLFFGTLSVNYVFSMAAPPSDEGSAGTSLFSVLVPLLIIAIITFVVNLIRKKLKKTKDASMKVMLVLSIIGIIYCIFFYFLASASEDSAFVAFIFQYIFVIPHAIVSLMQSIKRKYVGLIVMSSIGFVLYLGSLFTIINNRWVFGAGDRVSQIWYFLSFLFFLSFAIVWIVLSVKFLRKKPIEQPDVAETKS